MGIFNGKIAVVTGGARDIGKAISIKLAKEGAIPPYQGMWLATIILLPVGIFLTYKATSDSNLFNADAYIQPIKRFFIRKK